MGTSSEIFCILQSSVGGFCVDLVGAWWCLMGVWSMMPVLYAGDSKSTRFFFFAFLCAGSRFPWGFRFAGCIHDTSFIMGLPTIGTAAGDWRVVSSLQGVSGYAHLVRLPLHQLACLGWCSLIPRAGLLLVDWSSLVRPLASDSGEIGDCPGRSTKKQYVPCVLLMGFKLEDFLSARSSAVSFILGYLLHCGRWRRTRLRQRRLMAATSTGCSCRGLLCNFLFVQGWPVRGLVVRLLY